MATSLRRTNAPLSDKLTDQPERFDFFQAVRLMMRVAGQGRVAGQEKGEDTVRRQGVGHDSHPQQEIVRFRTIASHSFPASEITEVKTPAKKSDPGTPSPPEMFITFMGLTGPNGVLPQHYTSLIIDRLRERDHSLLDFLDLFNHRTISLFYRAWEKYRFPIAFERFRLSPPRDEDDDFFTFCLYSLVGLGTSGLRRRQQVDDETILYYAGHFAHRPANAISLEVMVADYFNLSVRVKQFQGHWLKLGRDDQSAMPSAAMPRGLNNQMGVNLIAGERVWDVQSRFRFRIGPLDYQEFRRFMPSGDRLRPLCQLTRTYVGPELDFEVQPVLKASQIPWCQLGGSAAAPARLGWNTWIRSGEIAQDAEEAIFFLEDV